jgi:glutamyl-tRNA reductase
MSLSVTGLSHKSSPVELREQLAFAPDVLPAALRSLHREFPGCAILSTCNRVEIYTHSTLPAEEAGERVRAFLSEQGGIPRDQMDPLLYDYHERRGGSPGAGARCLPGGAD